MKSNYIVEDDIPSYKRLTVSKKRKKTDSSKKIIIGCAILLIMIIVIIVASRIHVRDNYSSLEIEMVQKAENYVNNNNIENEREIYIDSNKLEIKIPDNCNKMSGVIYQNKKYYPYLICDNYESNYITMDSNVNIIGNKIILLPKGKDYYELGYRDKDEIQVSGGVNTSEEGIYNVYYIPKNRKGYSIRKVIVVDNNEVTDLLPILNIDNNEITIEKGQDYQDNSIAIDNKDGNITSKIIKVDNVNNNEVGEYRIVYSITNNLGYTIMAMKKIMVINSLNNDETSVIVNLSNDNMTNENIIISVSIIGSMYDYTMLPNKSITKERDFVFEVNENGGYEFVAYNTDGTQVSKIVKIDNINREIPKGTCRAILYNDKTVFSTNITTFNYIVGYNYIVDNVESGYVNSNYYTVNIQTNNEALIKVKDYINNESTIKCETVDNKYKYDPNGYRNLVNHNSRLRIPIKEALAKRGHTIDELNMCIKQMVIDAGPGTRYGVVAASVGLIECTYKMTGYVLSYNHTSGKVEGGYCNYNSDICGKLGVNSRWGSVGGSCNTNYNNGQCWHGLNCATYVRWAMCNGGMDLCTKGSAGAYGIVSKDYFKEADGVTITGNRVKYYSGKDLSNYSASQLVRMIKPGDIIAHSKVNSSSNSDHAYVVIGKDDKNIYTANDGYYYKTYSYNDLLKGEYSYRILFLDNYYANFNNKNNLYN